jgi:predicted kinase
VLLNRVAARAARGDDASEADEAVLRSQLASAEPLREEELTLAVTIRTDAADAESTLLREVRERLRRERGGRREEGKE